MSNENGMKNLLMAFAVAMLATGCWGSKSNEPGPQEVLDAFYTRLLSGDFKGAESLCDPSGMKEYIERISETWSKEGEQVMTIVPAILSETEIMITDVVKNGQTRTIFYKLTTTDGCSKEKVATLRKEEGAWKIGQITDKH